MNNFLGKRKEKSIKKLILVKITRLKYQINMLTLLYMINKIKIK